MGVTADQLRVKTLLTETIILLCKNGLHFKKEFSIEGLIGITLDDENVFLVNIKETIKAPESRGMPIVDPDQSNIMDKSIRKRRRSLVASETSKQIDSLMEISSRSQLYDDNDVNDRIDAEKAKQCENNAFNSSSEIPADHNASETTSKYSEYVKKSCSPNGPKKKKYAALDFRTSVTDTAESNRADDETNESYDDLASGVKEESLSDVEILDNFRGGAKTEYFNLPGTSTDRHKNKSPAVMNISQFPFLDDFRYLGDIMPGCSTTIDPQIMQHYEQLQQDPNQDIELVPGSGVYIPLRSYIYLHRENWVKGSKLVRRVVREVFPDELVLAQSSCLGKRLGGLHAGLDHNKVDAIKAFVQQHMPNFSHTEIVATINECCRDIRAKLRKKMDFVMSKFKDLQPQNIMKIINAVCIEMRRKYFVESC